MTDPDYILDLGGTARPVEPAPDDREHVAPSPRRPEAPSSSPGRPFISVHFECCNAFTRVYLNAAGTAYVGWCPRCAAKVTATIGPDGTTARTFRAG